MKYRCQLDWGVSVIVAFGVVACTAPKTQQPTSRVSQSVLSLEKGRYFEYAFVPARSLAEVRESAPDGDEASVVAHWLRELAELGAPNHAAGAVLGAALDTSGQAIFLPERPQLPLRYSCGITMVSPSYAITAAHCVADDTGALRLQMFRPSADLVDAVPQATLLRGSWPNLTHDVLDASNGYLVDEYDCEIAVRCDPRWGALSACPYGSEQTDVALLRCEGRPGDTYGYLRVAEQQPTAGTVVYMPWKHEVYDLEQSEADSTELSDHYVSRGTIETNLHYFGDNENQLLPLRSIPWTDGTERTADGTGWTDLMGCHGTSGSGLLLRDPIGYQLWGIATSGSGDLNGALCHDTAERLIAGEGPGSQFLGSNWTQPGVLMNSVSALLSEDCALSPDGAETRVAGSVLDGQLHQLTSWYSQVHCQAIASDVDATDAGLSLEASGDPSVQLEAMASMNVGPFTLQPDTEYRVGLAIARDVACPSCTQFDVSVGASVPVAFQPAASEGLSAAFAFTHSSDAAAPIQLTIRNLGDATRFVAPVVIPEGQANAFDTPFDRLEVSLFDVTGEPLGPAPMRFVGDGLAGFAAQLRASERMLLTRQALFAGATYHARLEASDYAHLSCGFVDSLGDVVLAVDCAPLFTLDASDVASSIAGFFVEADASAGVVTVEAVALASNAARDTDGDEIPDVLDSCPLDAMVAPLALDCESDPSGSGGSGPDDAGAPPLDGGAPTLLDAGAPPDAGRAAPMIDAGDLGGSAGEGGQGGSGSTPGAAGTGGTGEVPSGMGGTGGPDPSRPGDSAMTPTADAAVADPITGSTHTEDGCGCRVGAPSSWGASPWWLVFLLFGVRRRALHRAGPKRDL